MTAMSIRFATFALMLVCAFNSFALDNSTGIIVTPLIKTTQSWDGKPIVYPTGQAEITGLLIEIAPGKETGWHEHPVPSFAWIISGTLEVTRKEGQVVRLKAGDALAEVIDTLHNGRNVGSDAVKLVVFYTGAVGKPLTIKHPEVTTDSLH